MKIEEALFSYLKSYAGLSALVGTRIYPLVLPQNPTLPAVTYFKVSRAGERTLGGPNPVLKQVRIQFSCWGSTYRSAKDVAEQVMMALQDYTGTMGGTDGVKVLDANPVNERDIYEQNTGIYHIPVDVLMLHE